MESEGKWKGPKNRLRVQIYIGFSLFRSVFLGPSSLYTPTEPQTHWGSLRILINGLFIEISVSCLVCWTFSRSSQLAKHTPSLANPINQFEDRFFTPSDHLQQENKSIVLAYCANTLRNFKLFARAITEHLFFIFQQLHRSTTSWWWTKTTRVMRTVQ